MTYYSALCVHLILREQLITKRKVFGPLCNS